MERSVVPRRDALGNDFKPVEVSDNAIGWWIRRHDHTADAHGTQLEPVPPFVDRQRNFSVHLKPVRIVRDADPMAAFVKPESRGHYIKPPTIDEGHMSPRHKLEQITSRFLADPLSDALHVRTAMRKISATRHHMIALAIAQFTSTFVDAAIASQENGRAR